MCCNELAHSSDAAASTKEPDSAVTNAVRVLRVGVRVLVTHHSFGRGYVVCLSALSGSYSKATPAVGFHLACSFEMPYTHTHTHCPSLQSCPVAENIDTRHVLCTHLCGHCPQL